jgi:DNA-binding transcriptional LysR family regulator
LLTLTIHKNHQYRTNREDVKISRLCTRLTQDRRTAVWRSAAAPPRDRIFGRTGPAACFRADRLRHPREAPSFQRRCTTASAIEIGDYALMLELVRGRFGTTLLPASAITAGYPGLVAVPADDPRLAWDLSAAVSATRQPTAATSALLSALTQAATGCPAGVRADAKSDTRTAG